MEIPNSYIIYDTRISKDFKGITVSGYKRNDVTNAFQNSIINNKLEDAIRWCCELHCTGLNKQIWNIFETVYLRYVHINNPKLLFYLIKREKEYQNILKDYPKKHEIYTKNNQEIRNLYAEITSILVLTKKNNLFINKSLPKISKESYEKNIISKRMISKNLDKIIDFVHNTTSNNARLALNEIINNLSSKKGTFENCLYWILWLEKMEKNKKPEKIIFEKIENKEPFFDHYTFIIWNIIMKFENNFDKKDLTLLKKLEYLYKKNFKLTDITKRKYYIFIGFYLFFYEINWSKNLYQQEYLILQTNININSMYKNIILTIEKDLSKEHKKLFMKNYYKEINKNNKNIVKKIKNTNLNNELNKIVYTNYPEYKNEDEESVTNEIDEKEKLISKNMTQNDLIQKKEEIVDKKIEAFSNFIIPKKEIKENKDNKKKTVIDFYQSDLIKTIEIKKK